MFGGGKKKKKTQGSLQPQDAWSPELAASVPPCPLTPSAVLRALQAATADKVGVWRLLCAGDL